MKAIIDSLLEYLASNWPELIWIVIVAGCASYFAGIRSRRRWKHRNFLDRLNVSLTSVDGGLLKIRTIFEMDINDVFLNQAASARVLEMARNTTAENPILAIAKEDVWYYLNPVLNELSERFALGFLQSDAGRAVGTETYLLCLTCEKAGAVRTQKVRAMLVRKKLLEQLPEDEPRYESPTHSTRWTTLLQMKQCWQAQPHNFVNLELCF